jgi:hypothetical protein
MAGVKRNVKPMMMMIVRTAGLCLAVSALGLATLPQARAAGFLDKMNAALKNLPKPAPKTAPAAGTQAGNNVPAGNSVVAAAGTGAGAAAGAPSTAGLDLPGTLGAPAQVETVRQGAPALTTGNYRLGMPADQAVDQLKKDGLLSDGFARPQIGIQFRQLPDHPLIGAAFGRRQLKSGVVPETIGLMFTMYPNTPVVAAVSRRTQYETPAEAPNVANTLAALRKKYGAESGTFQQNRLTWLFDYRGHALPAAQVARLQQLSCAVPVGGLTAQNLTSKDVMGQKIADGYIESDSGLRNGAMHDPACFRIIRIDAYLEITQPGGAAGFSGEYGYANDAAGWAPLSNDLVQVLTVAIQDLALDYSASVLTRNTVLAGGEQNAQKQSQEASKNSPKL